MGAVTIISGAIAAYNATMKFLGLREQRKVQADAEEAGEAKYRAKVSEAKEKGLTNVIEQQAAPAPSDDEAIELARRRDAERLR